MNYLSLCNSLMQKCGISGNALATVAGQRGEAGRVTAWIDEAFQNLQLSEFDWHWMSNSLSFAAVPGQSIYTPAQCGVTDLGNWKMDSFRRYVTSAGAGSEIYMSDMPYDAYRDTFEFGTMRLTTGDPHYIAQAPDLSLRLGLTPSTLGYTVVGEYMRAPQKLTLDADIPHLPDQFHRIIVYAAMIAYGMYEAAPEVVQEGTRLYNQMVRKLMRDQGADIGRGGSLA